MALVPCFHSHDPDFLGYAIVAGQGTTLSWSSLAELSEAEDTSENLYAQLLQTSAFYPPLQWDMVEKYSEKVGKHCCSVDLQNFPFTRTGLP